MGKRYLWRIAYVVIAALVPALSTGADGPAQQVADAELRSHIIRGGSVSFDFAVDNLDAWSWTLTARGGLAESLSTSREVGPTFEAAFPIHASSTLEILRERDGFVEVIGGLVSTRGALLLTGPGLRSVVGNMTVGMDTAGRWVISSTLGEPDKSTTVFELGDVFVEFLPRVGRFRLIGEMSVPETWATRLGMPEAGGIVVGTVVVEAEVARAEEVAVWEGCQCCLSGGDCDDHTCALGTSDAASASRSSGPDVMVGNLSEIRSYGSLGMDTISAFAVGTVSCNIGDQRVAWFAETNEHPVISQSMYRLKDGRFEQIGMSWVKHGFYAIAGTLCGSCNDFTDGTQLGVGCSDPYSASLNGAQYNMSARSTVDAHSGYFPYPTTGPDPQPVIGRRLQVHNYDLDPALNDGAIYFVEGHYVTADDAAANNQNNNASYRRAMISDVEGVYTATIVSSTRRMQPGIRAWQDYEPSSVVETDIQVADDGLFILSAKVINLGGGSWRYEYAVQNLNATRSAASFSVPIEPGAAIDNVGFHDVDYHSGDPYSGTDWSWDVINDTVTWWTTPFETDPDANALRWGSLYNFWFESDVESSDILATIGLFMPGSPTEVEGATLGPLSPLAVCGDGDIEDPEECDPPDGVTCHTNCQPIVGDALRGGLLWDKWWPVIGGDEPSGNHPLYPPGRGQSGSTTFRCKECHGWDYKGVDGAYGSGSHFTGIPGVLDSGLDFSEMFDLLKYDSPANGHGFENYGLADEDIWDVVHFVKQRVIDTDLYMDPDGTLLGDETQGQTNYTTSPSISCTTCHGPDGTAINFGTPQEPQWVGTVAADNPWELLHKIRFGQPGVFMPGWLADGGTDQGAADIGTYAQATFPITCLTDTHCDDGVFCNGPESCEVDICVEGVNPCPGQPCDELTQTCGVANAARGGLLWDTWWEVIGVPAPTGDHPLYPPVGPRTGSETHRCKECHGWDYKGADGDYSAGSHYTGIAGVIDSPLTPEEMFELISSDPDSGPGAHGFAGYGLSEQDLWDLVQFVQDMAIDTDLYIDSAGWFLGDAEQGALLYNSGPGGSRGGVGGATIALGIACAVCHGVEGAAMNFGTPDQPEWVGTVAVDNPWELLHKIRFGQPGSPMGSWLIGGGSDQGAADIGLHAQLSFPVECTDDTYCDDDLFCNGTETCSGRFCDQGFDPCPGAVCDELGDMCVSGLCATPLVEAVGARYLAITPQPSDSTTPQAFLVEPECAVAGSAGRDSSTAVGRDSNLVSTPNEGLAGIAKYVGSMLCGGAGGICRSDADCNVCSFGHNPCLTDDDCFFGFCDDGTECNVSAPNCADQSACARIDYCLVSGDACIPGPLIPIDVNNDGIEDGFVATLVDDPLHAAFLTPAEWGIDRMRCSKSGSPCLDDTDCLRGICANGGLCLVVQQNCLDSSACMLNEACVPGRVYVTGQDIVPSELITPPLAGSRNGAGASNPYVIPTTYIVRANCAEPTSNGEDSDLSLPMSATMWVWADTNHDTHLNVTDIQLLILAIQGSYDYSSTVNGDLAGATVCLPQQILNVTDVLMALRAIQGEHYSETGCYTPCPPN